MVTAKDGNTTDNTIRVADFVFFPCLPSKKKHATSQGIAQKQPSEVLCKK